MASVVISGDTSGAATISAPAVAGTPTLTLPTTTDTLVGKATTDTLTNKTLTSPTLTTPALGTPTSGILTSCTGINYDGFKNRIINGAMVIDQRNAGASVTPSSSYTLDRWKADQSQSSKYTVQQNAGSVTPPTGFSNYLGVTSSSAYTVLTGDFFFISQSIEGFNTYDLAWGTASAATVTLFFWVRSSLTGTFGGALRNSASSRSYPFSYTISSANTWEQKSITIAGDTSGTWIGATNGIGINVAFSLGMGSTYSTTANAWATGNYASATGATSVVGTSGATFYITGVQLEKGSTATSFDYRDYGTELQLCQRYYYQRLGSQAVYWDAYAASGTYPTWSGGHPVQMRASPTCAIVGTYSYGNASSVGMSGITELTVNIQANSGASTTRTYFHSNAASGYSASAEL